MINRAFEAHKNGWYELSIPVFLAQADGICFESLGLNLYKRKGRTPAIKKELEMIFNDKFISSFLHPLLISLPISDPINKQQADQASVNRHAVLHGHSSDYGTHSNSLKVISHLCYIAWMFNKKLKKKGI